MVSLFDEFDELNTDNHDEITETRTNKTKKQKHKKPKKRKRKSKFKIIVSILFVIGLVILSLIGFQTWKSYNNIKADKQKEEYEKVKYKESEESSKARAKFDDLYDKIAIGKNKTDIKQDVTQDDIDELDTLYKKIDSGYLGKRKKDFELLKKKSEIQMKFNNFFEYNDKQPTKIVKKEITPNDVFKFNDKFNDVINDIYKNDYNDLFCQRINQNQLNLTQDAENILSIYDKNSSLFSQLGTKSNKWTFVLNDNVVYDYGELNSNLLKKLDTSDDINIQSVGSIRDSIEKLNYDWKNHFDFMNKVLSATENVANSNYNNIVRQINKILEEKRKEKEKEELEKRKNQEKDSDKDDSNVDYYINGHKLNEDEKNYYLSHNGELPEDIESEKSEENSNKNDDNNNSENNNNEQQEPVEDANNEEENVEENQDNNPDENNDNQENNLEDNNENE